jgi:hypothetical protein
MSDDIWAIQADLQALIARSSGDTRRVLNLAAEALITAGGMEDSKAQRERDERDALRKFP